MKDLSTNLSNKMLWEMSEKILLQKKELDRKLEEVEIEKERIQIEKEKIEDKVKQLWKQSENIHIEKERIKKIKNLIEFKHKEVMDSITYAERLQTAILPTDKYIDSFIYETLVFYRPKDIVSGDFYWANENDDCFFIAAADCTGHGVPGAIVSVICSTALNRSVKEFNLNDPAEILNKTTSLVAETFSKANYAVRDGMDISLLSISKKSSAIKWAGANNPLWIIRKGAEEIDEIKANKQPIGNYDDFKPFISHQVRFDEGDQVFMFSDGYPDQFGGDKGKKYKSKNLKRFFVEIQSFEKNERLERISKNFDDWKKGYEQIDDVCVVNIKF